QREGALIARASKENVTVGQKFLVIRRSCYRQGLSREVDIVNCEVHGAKHGTSSCDLLLDERNGWGMVYKDNGDVVRKAHIEVIVILCRQGHSCGTVLRSSRVEESRELHRAGAGSGIERPGCFD